MIISKSSKQSSTKLAWHFVLQASKICIKKCDFDVLNSAPYLQLAIYTCYKTVYMLILFYFYVTQYLHSCLRVSSSNILSKWTLKLSSF